MGAPVACRATPSNIHAILSEASHIYDRSSLTFWIEKNGTGWFVRDPQVRTHDCKIFTEEEFQQSYIFENRVDYGRLFRQLCRV